jgi:lipase chaperone LimK
MKIEAKARLAAETNPSIENKQKQIDLLRNSLPSSQNRRAMSQSQRLNTRKRILNLETQIVDERLKTVHRNSVKEK